MDGIAIDGLGRVVELHIDQGGVLPDEIGMLTELRHIAMHGIVGIPASLARASKLRAIHFTVPAELEPPDNPP